MPPGGRPRPLQPLRAAIVVVVAVVVGVFVLARTGSVPTTAATHLTSTSVPTTVRVTTPSTPTTVTTSLSTTTAPPTTLAPSKVRVLVLNGWTTRHAALYFQKKLSGAGYDTLAPTNATTEANRVSHIFVVSTGDNANGLAIAAFLSLSPSAVVAPTPANDAAVPAAMLRQADLVLVVGGDISSQVPANYNG